MALLGVAVLEGVVRTLRSRDYDWRAFLVSLFDLLGTVGIRIIAPIGLASPFFAIAYEHRLFDLELSSPGQFAILFLGQEFCYYWFHRASHRVRWFWASHNVHHSPEQICFAAAFRLGITSRIAGSTLFYVPLAWLGFDPRLVLLTLTINLFYQFWIHADWIPKLGWLEYVLNTPSHHRVHHARNPQYLDANYGGVLIVFDRMFGTFVAERDDLQCEYGLVNTQPSYNPIKVELRGWASLVQDVRRSRSLWEATAYMVKPPGWSPDATSLTTEEVREGAARAGDSLEKEFEDYRERTGFPAPNPEARKRAHL